MHPAGRSVAFPRGSGLQHPTGSKPLVSGMRTARPRSKPAEALGPCFVQGVCLVHDVSHANLLPGEKPQRRQRSRVGRHVPPCQKHQRSPAQLRPMMMVALVLTPQQNKTRFEVLWRMMLLDFYDGQQPATSASFTSTFGAALRSRCLPPRLTGPLQYGLFTV